MSCPEKRTVIECVLGDITDQPDMEAVVNAANADLLPGGGVCGAIHRAAGPELALECRSLKRLKTGDAVITQGYRLPNRYVIHCLGPVYGIDEPSHILLARCHEKALMIAEKHRIPSLAFPAISTGVFSYPLKKAAPVAVGSVTALISKLAYVRQIRFVLFTEEAYKWYGKALSASEGLSFKKSGENSGNEEENREN